MNEQHLQHVRGISEPDLSATEPSTKLAPPEASPA